MKARTLAFIVLVYAALTSTALIGTVGTVRLTHNWWSLRDAVFWLAYLFGGLGLLWGRRWSRGLLLVTSAASIIQIAFSGLFGFFRFGSLPRDFVLLGLLGSLPGIAFSVFIFVATLKLNPLEVVAAPSSKILDGQGAQSPSSAPIASRAVSPRLDLAYGCFALVALFGGTIALIGILPLSAEEAGAYEMLVMMPGVPAMLVGGALGLILSVVYWREWPLLLMSAACLSTIVAFEVGEKSNKSAVDAWCLGAIVILLFFCVRWFGFTRRRATQGPLGSTRN